MAEISLKNKTAVITGASRGIGEATARAFANCGANVILISRNKEKLSKLTSEINAKYITADFSNHNEIESAFEQIKDIDILVNNAGIYFTSEVINMDTSKWKNLLNINLLGSIYATKCALKKMFNKNYGRIIQISSISGKHGDSFGSAYSASKFGLIGFNQSLSQEVAEHNITANCICPGWVETDMAESIFKDPKYAELTGMPFEHLKEYSLEAVPIGRYIQPEEVANLATFLASDFASGINGQAINIDGGLCMH